MRSQGERPREKPDQSALWPWTSSFQNDGKINFYCCSHPVCSILLQQPGQTNTDAYLKMISESFQLGRYKTLQVENTDVFYKLTKGKKGCATNYEEN